MNRKKTVRTMAALALCAFGTSALALGDFTETFGSDSANWRITDSVTPMTWFSDDGPLGAGDAYASYTNVTFTGVTNGQLRILARGHDAFNSSGDAFVGSWLTSGVFQFSVYIRHNIGVPAQVGIRFASAANFPGGVALANTPLKSGVWTKLIVPIAANNPGFVSFEGSNFSNVFSSVGNVQVLLYVPQGYGGEAGPYKFDIDNPSIQISGAPVVEVSTNAPTYDRWMYPFNASSPLGNRPTASTFGTMDPDFDQRDGQAFFGFVLTNEIPSGLGIGSYEIVSCRFSATMSGGTTEYDPTQDSWTTYLDPTQAMYTADTDTGRPMELFGAGWRNGYTPWTFGENGPFSDSFSTFKGVRNVYPLGFLNGEAIDTSNSIDPDGTATNGFDPVVFAIGAAALTPGDEIPLSTTFTFDIDTANPRIQAYLQQALNDGILSLVLATLHPASFGGPSSYPVWDQKESIVGVAPTLEITYRLNPSLGFAFNESGTLVARWSANTANAILEGSPSLSEPNWQPLTVLASTNAADNETVLPVDNEAWFLRLRQP